MPGAHSKVTLHQCFKDVGGTDLWMGTKFNKDGHWWVGWHSSKGLDSWWRTMPNNWRLIVQELWGHDAEHPHRICHNVPIPSATPLHEPNVLIYSWNGIYDFVNGNLVHCWYDPMPLDVDADDMWPKGDAPNKAQR